MLRQISTLDQLVGTFDVALRSLCVPEARHTKRCNPADAIAESVLTDAERRHVAGLMRVNHAGEVCAQALYQGQALTADLVHVREKMVAAAEEEIDHLAWCEARLRALDASPGILNPFWYSGAWLIGLCAGLLGDKWSLGFVVETERQVSEHLQSHLADVPKHDKRTQAILEQMQKDEIGHAELAQNAGAAPLPFLVKTLMRFSARLMTTINYYF